MLLLVSGATATVRQHQDKGGIGILVQPRCWNSIDTVVASGLPWACDNDCFQRLDRAAYIAMLKKVASQPHLLWVVAPDVVGDAQSTLLRFRLWLPALRHYKLPVAFVAQDGQESLPVPWDHIACLFVGGSTRWKEGQHAARLVVEAKRRGKWVHIGRVNSARRERLFAGLGADSIDGSQYSRFAQTYIPAALERLKHTQLAFEEVLL